MEHLPFILINIVIAACIGGITNHLAIKMLFHPRESRRIAGYRIPFTPGLIPKRKDEIARSLGKVVADYLVTSQGLVNALGKSEFRTQLESTMRGLITDWTSREETVEQLCRKLWDEEQIARGKRMLTEWLQGLTQRGILWMWEERGWSSESLAGLLPDWSESRKQELVHRGAAFLVEEVKKYILSSEGDFMLKRLVHQMMDQAGGLFGTLAGIFMDEDKMVQKVKAVIAQKLDSPAIMQVISVFIDKKISELEEMSPSQLIEAITKQEAQQWIVGKTNTVVPWEEGLEKMAQLRWRDAIGQYREWLLGRIPWLRELLLRTMESNIEKVVAAIQLPKLVEEQVDQFPIERLEHIILSVSGREFSAITWLGALLGGIIGLVQSLFVVGFY